MLARTLFSILLVALSASAGWAQDPTAVDPDHYKLVFENDQVRVLRVHYEPGEKSVMHEHAAGVVIPLTTQTWLMHSPDGTSADASTEANVPFWTDAVVHLPENPSDEPGEAILVEFKKHYDKKHHDYDKDHDYDHEDDD
ncbi:MAG: hypothetical protein KAI97_01120 [Gemmatimonadetes bacterium]|nr:hypothetical protein [Gemmatimonadota bacterium]